MMKKQILVIFMCLLCSCNDSNERIFLNGRIIYYDSENESLVNDLANEVDSVLNLDDFKVISSKEIKIEVNQDSLQLTFFVPDTTQYYLLPHYEVFLKRLKPRKDKQLVVKLVNKQFSYRKEIISQDTIVLGEHLNFGKELWLILKSPLDNYATKTIEILDMNILGYAFNQKDSVEVNVYLAHDTVYVELPYRYDLEFETEDNKIFHYTANTLRDSLFEHYNIAFLLLDENDSVKYKLMDDETIYVERQQ